MITKLMHILLSNMYKFKDNFMKILAYEWYDMMRVKFLSKYDNMYNNNANHALKSSKNCELNV